MSTALLHHQRSHLVAAAAAVLAVAAIGVVFEVTQDDPAATNAPTDTTSVPHFRLTGTSHETGSWNHAGTISGGQTQLAP